MTQNSNNLKWRIVEYKKSVYIEKKYFGLFWYSFDWRIFEEFFAVIFLIGLVTNGITLALWFLFSLPYLTTMWCCVAGVVTLLILFNRKTFNSYADAQQFIKEELEEELKNNVTEITWDGQNISIEKKKDS